MAILSTPFTSMAGDRKRTAAELAKAAATLTTSGIVPIENSFLAAIVPGTMNVSLQPGEARLSGHDMISDEVETITLSMGHATYPRIDTVIVESNEDTSVRYARIIVVEGTPAASPAAPALTQTNALWQEGVCNVLVPAGATTLAGATITDIRTFCIGKHRHAISDITGLQDALNGKANSSHSHAISGVTGLQDALDGKAASSHSHSISNVSGLQTALDGKSDDGHTHDSRYYTESEMITKLAAKSDTTHTHDSRYYTESEVTTKLAAKEDTLDADQKRKITISTSSPSGGVNGDVWIKVI